MVTLQEYLENKYPNQSEKEQVTEILIRGYSEDTLPRAETKHLDGAELNLSSYPNLKTVIINSDYLVASKLTKLDLSNCLQLTELNVSYNHLTTLDLSHCQQLEWLHCADNYLTQIVYPTNLEAITFLNISNNNLPASDCIVFSQMRNLESLFIVNTDQYKINQGICNRFSGSLAPLQGLTKLKELGISNTDFASGLEYLPASLEKIYCVNTPLEKQLQEFETKNKGEYDLTKWRQAHLSLILTVKNETIKHLTEQLTKTKEQVQQLTHFKSVISPKYNQLRDYTQQITTKYQQLQAQLNHLEQTNQQLAIWKDKHLTDLKTKNTSLTELAEQNEQLNTDIATLQEQITAKEQAIANNLDNQALIEQLQQEKQALEAQLASKEQELTNLQKLILQQLINKKQTELDQLKSDIKQGLNCHLLDVAFQLQKEIDALEQQLANLLTDQSISTSRLAINNEQWDQIIKELKSKQETQVEIIPKK